MPFNVFYFAASFKLILLNIPVFHRETKSKMKVSILVVYLMLLTVVQCDEDSHKVSRNIILKLVTCDCSVT